MFLNNPIFGVGPNNFRKLCDKEKYNINELTCSTHPHNFYIQLLAETGLIGLLFLLIFYSFFIKKFLNYFKNYRLFKDNLNFSQLFIISNILINFFPFLPTFNFYNNWINAINFLSIGFFIYLQRKIDYEKTDN